MGTIDELLANNAAYAASFQLGHLESAPGKKLAVIACMDARLDPARVLGLREGDAHVVRNAGGTVTDDALRSIAVSQWMLGTEEVLLLHHTGCGMELFDDHELAERISAGTGSAPPFAMGAFASAEEDLREGIRRVRECAFLRSNAVRGFMYDVATGRLHEVQG